MKTTEHDRGVRSCDAGGHFVSATVRVDPGTDSYDGHGPRDFASGAVGRDRRREWKRPPGPHLCTKDRVGNPRDPRGKKGVPLRGKMDVPGNRVFSIDRIFRHCF